ncbi:MAG: hypothetical protein HZT43_16845 [Exiguobacterium profundum]|nr:MAG: hypothetical protein HZT43_16845 [Exiguobacterium profundum]
MLDGGTGIDSMDGGEGATPILSAVPAMWSATAALRASMWC